eukprot:366212-Chlamydomonas_euryale.AAC.25
MYNNTPVEYQFGVKQAAVRKPCRVLQHVVHQRHCAQGCAREDAQLEVRMQPCQLRQLWPQLVNAAAVSLARVACQGPVEVKQQNYLFFFVAAVTCARQ